MAGIGADIKDVLLEVGISYTILRDAGNYSGEYLDYEVSEQVTKPFLKEYFLEATLAYDTSGEVGDVIRFDLTGVDYLLMNKSPSAFENSITDYGVILYKSNVSGELQRPSGEAVWSDQEYRKVTSFQTIKATSYALMTEPLYGEGLEDEDFGTLDLQRKTMFIPSSYDTQVNDRYQSVSGEYFIVESVKSRRYSGVDVVELGEDTR